MTNLTVTISGSAALLSKVLAALNNTSPARALKAIKKRSLDKTKAALEQPKSLLDKRLFSLRSTGASYGFIAKQLNKEGFRTATGLKLTAGRVASYYLNCLLKRKEHIAPVRKAFINKTRLREQEARQVEV